MSKSTPDPELGVAPSRATTKSAAPGTFVATGDPSEQIDDGDPFLTYHDDYFSRLKLARRGEGAMWTMTDIDKGGQFNAIAVDGKGRIRIAYFNAGDQDLRYATND